MEKTTIFCLPHAGGSAANYLKWKKYRNDVFEWKPLELKGRGARSKEPFYQDFPEMVEDIFQIIRESVADTTNYLIFGHSMGGFLAYQTAVKLTEENIPLPCHLFLSGCFPPHITRNSDYSNWSDADFKLMMFKLGGLTKDILKNKEWNDLHLPVVKADYLLLKSYRHIPREQKLNIGITVFGGDNDPEVSEEELIEWGNYTEMSFKYKLFPGGHFFLNDYLEEINEIMVQEVMAANPGAPMKS